MVDTRQLCIDGKIDMKVIICIFYLNFRNKNGSVIIFAFCITVLLGFCALVIDYGIVVHKRISISNAADAAALAGAQELIFNSDNAEAVAKSYLEANGADPLDA